MDKNYNIGISNISFYIFDDDGNIKKNKQGEEVKFNIKDGVRFKPLEYLTETLKLTDLKEVK